jgi:hypothetical protein
MSITKLHERLERIERAYFAALAGRDPETVPSSVWRSAIFAAVPDTSIEEITEMFRWRARKAARSDGPSFGSVDLIETLIDTGMCKACAIRVVPLICTRATAPEDCICSDKCIDALIDGHIHSAAPSQRRVYTLSKHSWIACVLERARGRRREEPDLSR